MSSHFFGKKRYVLLAVLLILLIGRGVLNYPKSQAESRLQTKAVASFTKLATNCFDVTSENKVIATGQSRSPERLKAIDAFYVSLVQAQCLKNGLSLFANTFRGMNLSKIDTARFLTPEYDLWQGVLYDVDYGFTQFTKEGTICADGWISGSVGRGTCSWHGGYAHPRGTQIKFDNLPTISNPENASKSERYGINYSVSQPAALSSAPSVEATCIKSDEKFTNCFPKTLWNESFCSSLADAKLQVQIEKWWVPLWDVSGTKSSSCTGDNPYLINVSGTALTDYQLRLVFSGMGSTKGFNSNFAVVQE